MSKITGFKMGKGKTITSADDKQWSKEYLELEVATPEGTNLGDALLQAEKVLDTWLGIPTPTTPRLPGAADLGRAKTAQIITPEEVDRLPWKSYKEVDAEGKKKLVGTGHAGWLFKNEADIRLVQLLDQEHGTLELSPYEFKYSGTENSLINRRPLKGAK